jgi:hypothetical protein
MGLNLKFKTILFQIGDCKMQNANSNFHFTIFNLDFEFWILNFGFWVYPVGVGVGGTFNLRL